MGLIVFDHALATVFTGLGPLRPFPDWRDEHRISGREAHSEKHLSDLTGFIYLRPIKMTYFIIYFLYHIGSFKTYAYFLIKHINTPNLFSFLCYPIFFDHTLQCIF